MYRSVVWTEACPSRNRICSSSPVHHGRVGHRCDEGRGRQIGYAGLMGAPLDCIPENVGRHASFLSRSPFETLRNTVPSLTPECRSHASTARGRATPLSADAIAISFSSQLVRRPVNSSLVTSQPSVPAVLRRRDSLTQELLCGLPQIHPILQNAFGGSQFFDFDP